MTNTSRTRTWVPRLAAAAVATSMVTAVLAGTAQANPKPDGTPGQDVGKGALYVTSSTAVAPGQKISFAGEGFELAQGVAQKLNLKWDAFSSDKAYTGEQAQGTPAGTIGTQFQVQADGTVSGSLVVPSDLDDPSKNATSAGPHFVRALAGSPGTSVFSEDFTLDAGAAASPTVTATAATNSTRGTNAVTITVAGSGFTPGEDVSVARALESTGLQWTTGTGTAATKVDTIKAGVDGSLTGRIVLGFGVLGAGEHQLVFSRSSAAQNPATAQVTVKNWPALSNIALGSKGTLTVSNTMAGTTFDTLTLDPDPARTGDEIQVLDAPIVSGAAGVATGTFTLPHDIALLGQKNFTLSQSTPVKETFRLSAKVSPSSALLNETGYEITRAPDSLEQGLYQTAYSVRSKAVFATAANVLSTSTLYKLDPTTLEVIASVVPEEETPGARWAAYGVGVDDTNGTVWVTNTRQNTVAVYAQDDLSLLKQWPRNVLTHTRDVVADPARGVVYVSSASEGSTGDGAIGVFEADDLDRDGVQYELIENIAVHPRSEFSPMSLELDLAAGKLFSPSLTSHKVAVIDLPTRAHTLLELPDLTVGGRGASGIAYDHESRHLFVASQNSDEVLVAQVNADHTAATKVTEVATGAGALSVAFEPTNKLAYVANFGGSTVSVLDQAGTQVANLPIARANHVAEGPAGAVYLVDKAAGNTVWKVTPKVRPGAAAITGTAQVGTSLTATTGGWATGTTLTHQWLANGVAISGATGRTLPLTSAHLGKKITVTVTASVAGKVPARVTSAPTAAVAAAVLTGARPQVTGKAKVGRRLTAKRGTWTRGATLSYQWTANGRAIKGAKQATFTLTRKQKGMKVAVKVTGRLTGYTTLTKVSAAKKVKK